MTPRSELLSQDRLDDLLMMDSELTADARAVLQAMFDAGAIGPRNAVKQSAIAAAAGLSTRRLQQVNLDLLAAGLVVCTTCGRRELAASRPVLGPVERPGGGSRSRCPSGSGLASPGQFLARTDADVAPYREQLRRRAINCFRHLQLLKRACRLAADAVAAERAGAGTLFAETKP